MPIVFALAVLAMGCGEASSLVAKANGSHKLQARWTLKVHGLQGGAPEAYNIQVWENGSVFRAHVLSNKPGLGGSDRQESDILCDGKTVWQFNGKDLGEGGASEPLPDIHYQPADPNLLKPLYFWHIPEVAYHLDGTEKLLGKECKKLKTTQQDITSNTIDVAVWIDPGLGYLMKRTNTSGGEIYGGQSECLEVQAYPTFPAGHFDPPKNSQKSESPPDLWGIGISI
jgi:hypothetical protein